MFEIPVKTVRGTAVPGLAMSTFGLSNKEARRNVAYALELGCRHVDAARVHDNEKAVGEGIAAASTDRQDLFIASKVWRDDLSSKGIHASCEASLRDLGVEYLDLLLLHWPNPEFPLEASLHALQELREVGKIRHFGVCNFPPSLLRRAIELAPVFCNQVEYHPFLPQERLRAIAREENLLLTAYAPLASGDVCESVALQTIGKRHNKTAAQVVLRWLYDQEAVIPIPRSSEPSRIEENMDIFDFELRREETLAIDLIDQKRRKINPAFAPDWEQ